MSPSARPGLPDLSSTDLTAYLHPGWAPLIRPAPSSRAWMDATPESFAYRCLPLTVANSHGWELLNPCGFEAVWDGDRSPRGVSIRFDAGADAARGAVSLFGQGIITFHVEAIVRTPPGWNLWIGGSPNRPKDAIAPLTGIIETDWSPFTFTMNWQFTRSNQPIRFDAMEPFGFLFPLQRGAVDAFDPVFAPLASDPATAARFAAWRDARDTFQARMQTDPPVAPADRWQKTYYRGVDIAGDALIADHQVKLRPKPFNRSAAPEVPIAPSGDPEAQIVGPSAQDREIADLKAALAKRDWLLQAIEQQRTLASDGAAIERREGIGADEFLDRYYSAGRPVILTGEMRDWPALVRWTPEYLKARIGAAPIEFQGGRSANPRFELDKDRHRQTAPFDAFIDRIMNPHSGNDAYMTAANSAQNQAALAVLADDMGFLDTFLNRATAMPHGMAWIGPAGTFTPLHHDLTNNFICQVTGRKHFKVLPAAEVSWLYNDTQVFSAIGDLEAVDLDIDRYPLVAGARVYDVELAPGEILFMPFAWWHQVRARDFSVTFTCTNFRWANDRYATYP